MKYFFSTDGEKLAYYLAKHLFPEPPWVPVDKALQFTGRSRDLAEFFREITIANFACRLVAAGASLLDGTNGHSPRDSKDPIYASALKEYFREFLGVPHSEIDRLLRLVIEAVDVSKKGIPESVRTKLRRNAQVGHPHCYMCGTLLDFNAGGIGHNRFTLDHIWPQSYGGNSIPENLLPACESCNSTKKSDLSTWAMSNVQALVMGFEPTATRLNQIDGSHKFSLHYYAARKAAERKNSSLKDAFLQIGPWTGIRLRNKEDIGDFFNLTIQGRGGE